MRVIEKWDLAEYVDHDWPAEVVWRDLESRPDADHLEVVDESGRTTAAQLHDSEPMVAWVTDLPAAARKSFTLREAAAPTDTPLNLKISPGIAEVTNAAFGLRLSWEGADPQAGPIVAVRGVDGIWFGGSSFAADTPEPQDLRCEILAGGPVVVRLRQTLALAGGSTLRLTWEVDAATAAVRCWQEQQGDAGGAVVWHLGRGFEPTRAYWRPHTSSRVPIHRQHDYHRHTYPMRYPSEPERMELGLMYMHGFDRSNIWAGWYAGGERRDVLMVAPIRPSQTRVAAGELWTRHPSGAGYTHANRLRWAQHSAVEVDGEKRIDLALPLQEGTRPFALAMLDRDGADLSCEPGRNPANDIDRLCARLMALGLNDYARMDLDWPGIEKARFPGIFLRAGELPEIRRTLEEWDWFRETFFAHVEDEFFNSLAAEDMLLSKGLPPIGRDLAGGYLATGDESYAARAKEELVPRFAGLVEHMLGYSIGNELNFGMSLGQWIPRDALALDFILGSGQFTAQERLALLRKMLFLAETVISEDAWPRYESGLALSMRNFNTHVIFGRAVLAGRAGGHPKQKQWFAAIRDQIDWVLENEIDDEGTGNEALTYQIIDLGYFLQCALIMGTGEAREFLENPRFRKVLEYWIDTLTPPDPRNRNKRMYPPLGHTSSGSDGFAQSAFLALAAKVYRPIDSDFSLRCMRAWRACGSYIMNWRDAGAHGCTVWAQPLCFIDRGLLEDDREVEVADSRMCGGTGAMLRHRHGDGKPTEGFLMFKTGRNRGHFDGDEGSFIWYAYGTPMLIDYMTGYSPLMSQPWMNNRISIDHRQDRRNPGRFLAHRFSPGIDFLCAEQTISELQEVPEWPRRFRYQVFEYDRAPWEQVPEHRWRRHLLYLKPLETLVLLDDIAGTLPTDWSVHVLADSVRATGTTARFTGQLGIDLVAAFARPQEPDLLTSGFAHLGKYERGQMGEYKRTWYWSREDIGEADLFARTGGEHAMILRAHAQPGRPFLAMLTAHRAGGPLPEIAVKPDRNGFELRTGAGEADVSVDGDYTSWKVRLGTSSGEVRQELSIR